MHFLLERPAEIVLSLLCQPSILFLTVVTLIVRLFLKCRLQDQSVMDHNVWKDVNVDHAVQTDEKSCGIFMLKVWKKLYWYMECIFHFFGNYFVLINYYLSEFLTHAQMAECLAREVQPEFTQVGFSRLRKCYFCMNTLWNVAWPEKMFTSEGKYINKMHKVITVFFFMRNH